MTIAQTGLPWQSPGIWKARKTASGPARVRGCRCRAASSRLGPWQAHFRPDSRGKPRFHRQTDRNGGNIHRSGAVTLWIARGGVISKGNRNSRGEIVDGQTCSVRQGQTTPEAAQTRSSRRRRDARSLSRRARHGCNRCAAECGTVAQCTRCAGKGKAAVERSARLTAQTVTSQTKIRRRRAKD